MEAALGRALAAEGWKIQRAHGFDRAKGHGFIDSQKMGMEVFRALDADAPLIVAEAVWQYSHHVLAGLTTHRGPILTVANWSGRWPGLVGMLNLNGSLTKADVPYSTLWSETFTDAFFKSGLKTWLATGALTHDQPQVRDLALTKLPDEDERIGREFGRAFQKEKAILGVFDEGCMGMFNAIVPDELLHPTGVLRNINTGVESTRETDATGRYIFDFVEPGTYTIAAEMPGFAKTALSSVILNPKICSVSRNMPSMTFPIAK